MGGIRRFVFKLNSRMLSVVKQYPERSLSLSAQLRIFENTVKGQKEKKKKVPSVCTGTCILTNRECNRGEVP